MSLNDLPETDAGAIQRILCIVTNSEKRRALCQKFRILREKGVKLIDAYDEIMDKIIDTGKNEW